MELIESLLTTNQSDELKEGIAYKLVMKTVTQPMTSMECRKVILRLTDWIISSDHRFLRETSLKGFDALVSSSFSVFKELVDPAYFKIIFADMKNTKPVSLIGLVITIFSKFEKSPIAESLIPVLDPVRTDLVLYLGHHSTNSTFLQSLGQLYTMFPFLLPVSSQDITQLGSTVVHHHSSHPPHCQCSSGLDRLLIHVWSTCPDPAPCLDTLQTVYSVLSSSDSSCPPACLSIVLEAVSPTLLEQSLPVILNQPQDSLVLVLSRVIAWQEDRPAPDLANHVLSLVTALGRDRPNLVASVSQTCLVRLVQQVTQVTTCRDQLVTLVVLMLYGEQHSQAAFQSLLPFLPEVLEVLARDKQWPAREMLLEATQYYDILFPGLLAWSDLETALQEENLPQMSDERRLQLEDLAWRYPDKIQLDRRPGQLAGLVNLGNTCYMNCVLQALFNTAMFLSQVGARRTCHAQPVLSSLQKVFRSLKLTKRSFVRPGQFLEVSRPPWFDPGLQQDCSEFFTFLIHSLEEEERQVVEGKISISRSDKHFKDGGGDKDRKINEGTGQCNSSHDSGVDSGGDSGPGPSLVQSVFGGQVDTCYQCQECSHTSQVITSFTELHLPIPRIRPVQNQTAPALAHLPNITISRLPGSNQLALPDLVRKYLAPEDLLGDNQYQCDKCEGLRDAVKTTQIKAAPQHLTITLLRFKYDSSSCRKVKLLTPVECPDTLCLPITGGQVVTYQLYSVVVHSGQSSEGGHYYTWVKGRQGEEWHYVSDEEVETVPSRWDQETQSRTDTPYMLFYRREGLMQEAPEELI
eukprot:GFUD01040426.1.p1 GENE.GFUD01040426.1~~GFUD01040426.1.p1  ORF type:complete len:819 (+),score=280.29 GFUD01040426.1:50-2458(+)